VFSPLNPVTYYRAARWLHLRGVPVLPRVLKVFCELVFHCELPYTAKIGPGFEVAYRGFGIVVHHRAEIGRNVVLSPCVTIGGRSGKYEVPRIGDEVFVASGARILGDIRIGDGAVIGANAVVIHSVPARSIAAGVPARIVRENIDSHDFTGWPRAGEPEEKAESRPAAAPPAPEATRVVLFIESLELGGSERQCLEMARLLSRHGYAVTVGCLRASGPLRSAVEESGLPLVEFPVKSLLRPRALIQMARLAAYLRKNKVQVVHTNDLYSNLFAVPAAHLARVPVIVSSQRDLSHWWWYTPAKRKLLRIIQRSATWILVNSEAIRRDLVIRDGINSRKIRVVHNGVDAEKFSPRPSRRRWLLPQIAAKDRLVITVANMHIAVKGHGELISAAKTVWERNPDVRFVLVGDGEMRAEFERRVSAAGLKDVVLFLGNRTDVPALLSCCDLGVLPSRAEGLPNAILEYMASGLPVVATRVGGVPEIIEDEVSGLLVAPGDPEALARAILRVLSDDSLRARLAEAGRERVRREFDSERVVDAVSQLYQGWPEPSAASGKLEETLLIQ
jgi:L-malate glycosyltransferase